MKPTMGSRALIRVGWPLAAAAMLILNPGCASDGYTGAARERWMDAQSAQATADIALNQGNIDQGAAMYSDLWRAGARPDAPDGSPFTWSVGMSMDQWSRRLPELAERWKPLVPETRAFLEQPNADFYRRSEFLLIAQAANDDASLIGYFESIAGDWRAVNEWKADRRLSERASTALQLAGRSDLATVIARSGKAAELDAAADRVNESFVRVVAPVLAPMLKPK